MKKSIQLKIAEPCHERWDEMQPEERGRFCASCQKTVVDFSTMSDQEILAALARAGQGACGRLAPDQMERGIGLTQTDPASGRGWRRAWQWVVAGLLVSAEARAQQPPKSARTEQHAVKSPADTVAQDSIHYKVLPQVVVMGYGRIVGKLSITGTVTTIESKDDSTGFKKLAADTLTALGFLPKKELSVYPNPVRRGMAMSIGWEGMETGEYQVELFSSAGALVQRRVMMVGSVQQVDLLEIPASLAAGVYFLRVARAGVVRVLSRKVAVLQ